MPQSDAQFVTTTVVGVMWNYANDSTALTRLSKANDPYHLVNTDITSEPVPAVGTGAGSSPFDELMPWGGMYECNHDGTKVTYKKGESGFSRTANDTVIWIPEYWMKVIHDIANSKIYFYSSSAEATAFTKAPGSGKFVGRYKTGSGYVSKSGISPQASTTIGNLRTGSKNKGGKWRMNDYATWCAYTFLFIIEFADWHSQEKLGQGFTTGNTGPEKSGGTDIMTYHTGSAGNKTAGSYQVQYRGIENPYGVVREYTDGINFLDRRAYICTDPSKYASATSDGYIDAGVTLASSDGFITGITPSSVFEWAFFFPTASGGSATTYIPDCVYCRNSWRSLDVGGSWGNGNNTGWFDFRIQGNTSDYAASVGARLLADP